MHACALMHECHVQNFREMDGLNLFGVISVASLVLVAPAAIVAEASMWPQALATARDLHTPSGLFSLPSLAVASGLFYQAYNQLAYRVLRQGISPLGFSIGNACKRAAAVIASVAVFSNPVSPLTWIGSAIAFAGTCMYSVAHLREGK